MARSKRRRLTKQERQLEKLRDLLRRARLKQERPICNFCGEPVGSCERCRREMGLT
ncbi:hypothetical protein [Candidatus Pyrohabitans sp.]